MSGTSQGGGSTLAVSREKLGGARRHDADVIDLVQLPRGTRPTPNAYLDHDEVETRREMTCDYYHACLSFAARVRWKSFHCRQCPQHPERAGQAAPVEIDEEDRVEAAVIKLR